MTPTQSVRVHLYSGDDLDNAAQRSRIDTPLPAGMPAGRRHRLWHDIRNAKLRELLPGKRWVSSRTSRDKQDLTMLFKGSLRTLDYCADAFFGRGRWTSVPAPEAGESAADMIVADHPLVSTPADSPMTISSPPWVRLELDVAASWKATLAAQPVAQRKRVARFLRRFNYRASVSRGKDAVRQFRAEFLEPEIRRQFGASAIIESEKSFIRQYGHGLRLDLLAGNRVVASNVLLPEGTRLAIAKGARNPEADGFKGQMDTLDYFTLLLAQIGGFSTLDFGLSRPHLEDGPLRYKAKWGTRIVPAGGVKASTRIICRKLSPAVRSILRRNRFLEREGDGFILRVLVDRPEEADELPALVGSARIEGIRRIDLLHPADGAPPAIGFEPAVPLRNVPVRWLA